MGEEPPKKSIQLEETPADDTKNSAPRLAREIAVLYTAALILVLIIVLIGQVVPFVAQNTYALVAVVFVGLPYWWLGRRGLNFEDFGLTWRGWKRGVLWGLLLSVLTALPFAFGYAWWETRAVGHNYAFAWDNYAQWPLELQGRPSAIDSPDQGASTPEGVWVWADGAELRVLISTLDQPIDAHISMPVPEYGQDAANPDSDLLEPARTLPKIIGPARILDAPDLNADTRSNTHSDTWTVRLERPNARAELVFTRTIDAAKPLAPPRSLSLRATPARVPIHLGPDALPAQLSQGELRLERGIFWIVLWLLTQLIFIALPEEFFYRGYLQTRLAQYFQARRAQKSSTDESTSSSRAKKYINWLQLTPENILTSVLFALGHLLIPIGGVLLITRASVFFPSLVFGWLRARTDSIAASIVYHAAANMMVLLAAPHFF